MTNILGYMFAIPWQLIVLDVCSAVVFILVVAGLLLRTRKSKGLPEAKLDEDLSEYPPAPPAGAHRLLFESLPARLRLVILAPSGSGTTMEAAKAEGILESINPGLGSVAQLDKPRVRIWPPQLS